MFLRPSLHVQVRVQARSSLHLHLASVASRAVTGRLGASARLASSLHCNSPSPSLELHPHPPTPLHHRHSGPASLPFLFRDDHSAPPAAGSGSGSGAPPANGSGNGNGNGNGDGKPPRDGDDDSDLPPTPSSGAGKRSPLASPTGRSKAVVFRASPRRQPGNSTASSDPASADSADAKSSPPSSSSPSSRSSAGGRLPPSNSGDDPDDLADSTGPTGQLQTMSPPESYSPVMILPITRRPLFPGFYKTVVIKDPDVIAAIKELARTQQPYVTAVLLKDEDADQDRVSDLDEIYRMGVFCQITNVYHSAMPAAAAVAAGGGAGAGTGGEDGPSLTAILYPHRRVRVKGLVTSKDKVPRAVVEEAPLADKEGVVDSAADKLAANVLTGPISDAAAPTLTETSTAPAAPTTTTPTPSTPAEDPNEETSPQAYLPSKFNVSMAKTEPVFDEPYKKGNQLIRALTSEIVSVFKDIATLNPLFREQIAAFSVSQASATIFDDPSKLADFAAAVSGGSDAEELQGVLDSLVIEERLQKALYVLKKELVNAQLQSKISKEVETKIQKRQREYYLMEQLKGIKKELGLESDGKDKLIDKFKDRLEKAQIPAAVKTVIDEEMAKLGHLDPSSSEFNVTRNYLDWLTCLPWSKHSSEELDVAKARIILDEDHYGLKDVKDRILEFIAVGKLKGTVEGKIICLSGPPGVGKTSIGKSIARALNREFYRFSVGGLSDVAEIKGHRRTYVGAMPGKMVQALKKVQTENPLVLIDEIDKLGKGMQGDPASALLELLDPEQNNAFLDHYLDVPLDLSKVLFVCTANVLETIPAPLLDRMEVIQLSGYVADEKAAIAERYLAPQAKHACGLAPDEGKKAAGQAAAAASATESPVAQSKDAERETVAGSDIAATADDAAAASPSDSASLAEPSAPSTTTAAAAAAATVPVPDVQLTRDAIDVLIRYYCRESGVRNLKKHIEKIYRKAAFRIVADGASEVTITPDNLKDYVGNPPFQAERLFDQPPAGVVMGLAWTAMGGSALYIESVLESGLSRDAKPMFKTTGQLGDVMKESTAIALTYAKTFLAERFKDLAFFEHAQIHLHVPEGAQPKDGPSAGITMTTALISLASRTPVPGDIAMTGELTLTGKVLKIGGLKEKTISAKRSGVKTILFPKANAADWAELPDYIKEGLTGVPVEHYSDVFEACFGEAVKTGEFAKEAWRPGPKEQKKSKAAEE